MANELSDDTNDGDGQQIVQSMNNSDNQGLDFSKVVKPSDSPGSLSVPKTDESIGSDSFSLGPIPIITPELPKSSEVLATPRSRMSSKKSDKPATEINEDL